MKVEFEITDALHDELTVMSELTGKSIAKIFGHSFTLMRIHAKAAQDKQLIAKYDPEVSYMNGPRDVIKLPFDVKD